MHTAGFIANGWARAKTAVEAATRTELQQKYAAKLAAATPAELAKLNADMKREIARRMTEQAPRWALY